MTPKEKREEEDYEGEMVTPVQAQILNPKAEK